jgi:hypothetical protein
MSRVRKSTMVELVEELEKVEPSNGLYKTVLGKVIQEAEDGEYHNYKNKKYVCGKVALLGYLRLLKLDDLAARVIDGEFDEEADEEDLTEMRRTAPKAMWHILGL